MPSDEPSPRQRLSDVYWLGGGSGAGKSTIAHRLADRHALRVYATDDVMAHHARRTTPEDSPFLHKFTVMSVDERWANRSPETMLETFHWFLGEGFGLIVEDILAGPAERALIEGFRLLPHLVKPLAAPAHAVWLLPTPEFRRAAFDSRGTLWTIANQTSDPERALRNLLERDRMFTERLRVEARRLDLPVIEVRPGLTVDDLADQVTSAFGL
jgi:2-phosphoglycerate kinase